MSLKKGDVVAFDFRLEHGADRHRAGIGIIADNEINYSCWPPGRTIEVSSSNEYKPGTYIAVCTHNLRRITPP